MVCRFFKVLNDLNVVKVPKVVKDFNKITL